MAEIYREDIATIDLTEPLLRESVGKTLATGDKLANRIGVRVRRRGQPVDLTGHAVTGYFIRPDLQTVVMDGATDGDLAYVDIPQACLTERGAFSLAIKIAGDGVTQTVRVLDGSLILTQTDALLDPGNVIPTLDDIFAQIAAMEQARAEAEAAAANANEAATLAVNSVLDLQKTAAPVIVETTNGDDGLLIADSASRPLVGMSLFGKTLQEGMPSPDAPVPLMSLAEGAAITVFSGGKNLLPYPYVGTGYGTGVTFVINDDGSIKASGTATATSVLRLAGSATNEDAVVNVTGTIFVSGEKVNYKIVRADGKIEYVHNKSITLAHGDKITYVYVDVQQGVTVNSVIYPQIERGTKATAYEPYTGGGYMTVSTPNGLPGIPVTSGGNYFGSDGQQWVCDEVDFGRGVYRHYMYSQTMTGSNAVYCDASLKDTYGTVINLRTAYEPYADKAQRLVVCDKIPGTSWNDRSAQLDIHSIWTMSNMQLSMRFPAGMNINTLDDAKAWLDANPIFVLYALATPIETPLSPDELTGSDYLTSQYPYTEITNDGGAGMRVKYIADTQNYIDQRIAAMLNV